MNTPMRIIFVFLANIPFYPTFSSTRISWKRRKLLLLGISLGITLLLLLGILRIIYIRHLDFGILSCIRIFKSILSSIQFRRIFSDIMRLGISNFWNYFFNIIWLTWNFFLKIGLMNYNIFLKPILTIDVTTFSPHHSRPIYLFWQVWFLRIIWNNGNFSKLVEQRFFAPALNQMVVRVTRDMHTRFSRVFPGEFIAKACVAWIT